ncbi:MAG: diphosphate--fructose-6-phosphate 1-phosphotransferase [Oligoflexales bacterium]|nr:diphosphate--fructose-6-phosphate 1-phosphotransferase [Oligoflexales bacterium]
MHQFAQARRSYRPRYPLMLDDLNALEAVELASLSNGLSEEETRELAQTFSFTFGQATLRLQKKANKKSNNAQGSRRIAVVLSGGPAPGGHNVICGLYDSLLKASPEARLFAFRNGPAGIIKDDLLELTPEQVNMYLNSGGFDMIGTGRTKIEGQAQFESAYNVLKSHEIDALVIIGGDDSNTNAAWLAEYFKQKNPERPIQVVGVPKTIDGDLRNKYLETTFGFHTAAKLYAELTSNVAIDARSSRKYYHFIRLMGRHASHITLETALQTQPNFAFISEEVEARQQTLNDVVDQLADMIMLRSHHGKEFGVVLVPEGLIESIPEMQVLISELNSIIAESKDGFEQKDFSAQDQYIKDKLGLAALKTYLALPIEIQHQLLFDRDPHGNVQVSQIETEKLVIHLLKVRLKEEAKLGNYRGKFAYRAHFFGYEGRCAAPSNFDADYAYALGKTAMALINVGCTGYMSVVSQLSLDPSQWHPLGVPLASMLNFEMRGNKRKLVIKKSVVDLRSETFSKFSKLRKDWILDDAYIFAGPIQYFGDGEMTDAPPITVMLEADSGADFYR